MIKRASYWLSTGLLAAAMLSGGLAELILRPETVQGMSELGYPAATSTVGVPAGVSADTGIDPTV